MSSNPSTSPDDLLRQAQQALDAQQQALCVELCTQVLQRDAVNLQAHRLRGIACSQYGDLDRAITDLAYVLDRDPADAAAAFFFGRAMRGKGQHEGALGPLPIALGDRQLRPHALFEIARSFKGMGNTGKALENYRQLLQEQPKHAAAAANLAVLLEQTHQLEEALNWAERALLQAPGNTIAQLTRARVNRRLQQPALAAEQLQRLLQQDLTPLNRTLAMNQLAQCLDSQGEHPAAFKLFAQANELQRENDPNFELDDYGSYGIELTRYLTQWMEDHPPADWSPTPEDERTAPVFLVGFPLSGATELGNFLGAHPKIEVLQEEELLLEVRRKWFSVEHFHRLEQMTDAEVLEARRHYWQARAAAHHNPDAQVLVDMLPLNAMYLPLIYRLFPEAKIILAQRDPRDTCLSCFFQTFSLVGAMPYFLRLDSTCVYFAAISELLAKAEEVLPQHRTTVRFEDLAENSGIELQRIIEFLELEWRPELLQDENAATLLADEAGKIGRWNHYREQLAPVLDTLEPWAIKQGYAPAFTTTKPGSTSGA
jgi:tetratricopeptide (TPR) repeat protein